MFSDYGLTLLDMPLPPPRLNPNYDDHDPLDEKLPIAIALPLSTTTGRVTEITAFPQPSPYHASTEVTAFSPDLLAIAKHPSVPRCFASLIKTWRLKVLDPSVGTITSLSSGGKSSQVEGGAHGNGKLGRQDSAQGGMAPVKGNRVGCFGVLAMIEKRE